MKSNKVQRREEMNTKMKKSLLVVVMVFGMIVSFGGNKVEASEKVDINSATIEELQKLDGVGAPLAQKIIDARPYKTVDELKAKVVGIGPAKMKAIQDQGLAVAESFPEKVDINKASFYDLQFLAGVGAPLAQKIIDARPYKNLDELQEKVAGIGPEKLKAIKEQGLAIAEEELTPKTEKKISEWFPDPVLADYMSSVMKKDKDEVVSLYTLNIFRNFGQYPYNYAHFKGDISTLEGVQHLTKIEKLRIENTQVVDISQLSKLPNLYQTYLINNSKINVKQLANLTKPEDILVINTKNEDWSFLSKLTQTKILRLEGCELEDQDIKKIELLTNLTSLGLNNNNLTDISCLSSLENLQTLSIANNRITSIDVITNYSKLTSLNAGNNEIKNISNLSDIKKISVDVRNNRIGDLDELVRFIRFHGDNTNMNGQQTTYLEPIKVKKRKKIEVPINFTFTTPGAELVVGGDYDSVKKITTITEKDLVKDENSNYAFHYSAKSRGSSVNIKVVQPVILEADKEDLKALYDSVVNLEKEMYTEDSWNKLQEEIAKAKQLLEKEDATIEELNLTEKNFEEAYNALRIKTNKWFPDPALANRVTSQLGYSSDEELLQKDLDKIKVLNCQYANLKDLTGLRYLKNLGSLTIFGNKNLEDISELTYCKNLRSLQAHECNISNIDALANSNSLVVLRLDYNKITNIDALSSHPNLTDISINNNQITDISPINKLEKLREIYMSVNKISDMSNVYWPVVEVISAESNSIVDISGLKDSNRLTTLTVGSGNGISFNGKLHCLSNKEKLTILTLGAALETEDLEPISTLKNLTRLSINGSNTSDYSPLSTLTQLESLSIVRSGIDNSNVGTLANVKAKSLDIRYNNITDIESLNKLRANIGYIVAKYQTTIAAGTLTTDGDLILKNPIKDIDGNLISPDINSSNMSYQDDEIRWKSVKGERECIFGYKTPDQKINYSLTMRVTYTDKRNLQKLFETLNDTVNNNYTDKSWTAFKTALDSAKIIVDKNDATKEEVDQSTDKLQKAFDNLVEKASSKEELTAFVNKIDKLYWRQDYSAGYSELIAGLSKAQKIIENEDASQAEVDDMLAELKKLEENLVTFGNAAIPLEQRLAEARVKFLELLNEERTAKGMNTLAYSDGLNTLADIRADEQQIYYSHTRPNGSTVLYAGRPYGFNFLEECLTDDLFRDSRGYQKSGEAIGTTLFNSWKSSSAHYAIMVRSTRQTHIGLSFVVNNGNTFRMYGVLLLGWN